MPSELKTMPPSTSKSCSHAPGLRLGTLVCIDRLCAGQDPYVSHTEARGCVSTPCLEHLNFQKLGRVERPYGGMLPPFAMLRDLEDQQPYVLLLRDKLLLLGFLLLL